MNIYLIHFEDVSQIQLNKSGLINAAKQLVIGESLIYQSPYFVEGTGYAKTVSDEIDLVLSSQATLNLNKVNKNKFIKDWDLEAYLSYEIEALSGGWRKFLGIALFTIQNSDCKIYFDSFRQLSDRLISILINNLSQQSNCQIFFFEYDANYINHSKIKRLSYSGSKLVTYQKETTNQRKLTETNYE